MSSDIKHTKLKEDPEEITDSKINIDQSNVKIEFQDQNALNNAIAMETLNQNKMLVSESINLQNTHDKNLLEIKEITNSINNKMDNDMNQKIILDDMEAGGGNDRSKSKSIDNDVINLQKDDKKKEDPKNPTFQKQMAGGIISSVKTTFTNSLESCLFAIPKHGKVFFDVNTKIIKERLIQGVLPYQNKLYERTKEKPDLYGPFWIYTSVVFCLAASGSIYQYIHGPTGTTPFTFAEFVSTTCFWIYLIGFIFPLVLFLILKYSGSTVNYIHSVCIYGYTFSIFIPVSVVCVFFSSFVDWIFLLYAGVSTVYILVTAFSKYFHEKIDRNKKYTVLVLIGIVQLILVWSMSHYFFNAGSTKVSNSPKTELNTNTINSNIASNSSNLSSMASNISSTKLAASVESSIKIETSASNLSSEKVNELGSSQLNKIANEINSTSISSVLGESEVNTNSKQNNELDALKKQYEETKNNGGG